MLMDRVCDPVLLAVERIANNPKGAFLRMKSDQKKVKQLEAELDKLRWKLVSEGLPKDSKVVYVIENHTLRDGYCAGRDWTVWFGCSWRYASNVTHWKPIILPEKEAKNE